MKIIASIVVSIITIYTMSFFLYTMANMDIKIWILTPTVSIGILALTAIGVIINYFIWN